MRRFQRKAKREVIRLIEAELLLKGYDYARSGQALYEKIDKGHPKLTLNDFIIGCNAIDVGVCVVFRDGTQFDLIGIKPNVKIKEEIKTGEK